MSEDSHMTVGDSSNRTLKPIVTGQSVLAVKYKDGVVMIADTLLCYGNFKKFKDIERLYPMRQSNTLIGFSGEFSDAQFIQKSLSHLETQDFENGCENFKSASEICSWLSRVYYQARNKFDPYFNQVVVAGFSDERRYEKKEAESFLGYVDYHGTSYSDAYVATGYGAYFALPLLRDKAKLDMTEEEAITLLVDCMKILFARDCLGHNRVQIGTVTREGIKIGEPFKVHPTWSYKAFTRPTLNSSVCAMSW